MTDVSGPYLTLATFCEMTVQRADGVLSLINVVDRYYVRAQGSAGDVPKEMPETIVNWNLVITLKSGAARGSSALTVTPEGPSGLKESPIQIPVHFEGANRGISANIRLGFNAKMPGLYWFWIELDGNFLTKVPLEVIYQPTVLPAGSQAQ